HLCTCGVQRSCRSRWWITHTWTASGSTQSSNLSLHDALPISRGQDLLRNDERTPSEILLNRLSRQQEQLARLKDDEIMETILNTDRKSTRLNSSHVSISYAVFCLKKKIKT